MLIMMASFVKVYMSLVIFLKAAVLQGSDVVSSSAWLLVSKFVWKWTRVKVKHNGSDSKHHNASWFKTQIIRLLNISGAGNTMSTGS